MWDANQYRRFASERHRPFYDLLARVRPESEPRLVVDFGCGDGPLTMSLADRWPSARIVGVDASAEMLAAARAGDPDGRVEWRRERAEEWRPGELGAPIDVLVTNAALQWVPTHRDLLPRWIEHLAPGGWLALQIPGNFHAPSHRLMREVAARHTRARDLLPVLDRAAASDTAVGYLSILSAAGLRTDAWETSYVQVLDPAGAQDSGARVGPRHRAATGARRPHRREGAERVPGGVRPGTARGIPTSGIRGAVRVPANLRGGAAPLTTSLRGSGTRSRSRAARTPGSPNRARCSGSIPGPSRGRGRRGSIRVGPWSGRSSRRGSGNPRCSGHPR